MAQKDHAGEEENRILNAQKLVIYQQASRETENYIWKGVKGVEKVVLGRRYLVGAQNFSLYWSRRLFAKVTKNRHKRGINLN